MVEGSGTGDIELFKELKVELKNVEVVPPMGGSLLLFSLVVISITFAFDGRINNGRIHKC